MKQRRRRSAARRRGCGPPPVPGPRPAPAGRAGSRATTAATAAASTRGVVDDDDLERRRPSGASSAAQAAGERAGPVPGGHHDGDPRSCRHPPEPIERPPCPGSGSPECDGPRTRSRVPRQRGVALAHECAPAVRRDRDGLAARYDPDVSVFGRRSVTTPTPQWTTSGRWSARAGWRCCSGRRCPASPKAWTAPRWWTWAPDGAARARAPSTFPTPATSDRQTSAKCSRWWSSPTPVRSRSARWSSGATSACSTASAGRDGR